MATATKVSTTTEASPDTHSTRTRSPNYPAFNLEVAIKRAKQLYSAERMNATPATVALKHWGFKAKSSGGIVTIAALKAFGLIQDTGSADTRKLQLTENARRILLDERPESAERDAAIKNAALLPKIHAVLWSKWGVNPPSDENLRHALIFDLKFNENSVEDFIKEYKSTIAFAKLTNDDVLSGGSEDIGEDDSMPETGVPAPGNQSQSGQSFTVGPYKPIGQAIPVTRDCSMTVSASGMVTQEGIDQLMTYLKLIRNSFPVKPE